MVANPGRPLTNFTRSCWGPSDADASQVSGLPSIGIWTRFRKVTISTSMPPREVRSWSSQSTSTLLSWSHLTWIVTKTGLRSYFLKDSSRIPGFVRRTVLSQRFNPHYQRRASFPFSGFVQKRSVDRKDDLPVTHLTFLVVRTRERGAFTIIKF